jgi:hypothetical protein
MSLTSTSFTSILWFHDEQLRRNVHVFSNLHMTNEEVCQQSNDSRSVWCINNRMCTHQPLRICLQWERKSFWCFSRIWIWDIVIWKRWNRNRLRRFSVAFWCLGRSSWSQLCRPVGQMPRVALIIPRPHRWHLKHIPAIKKSGSSNSLDMEETRKGAPASLQRFLWSLSSRAWDPEMTARRAITLNFIATTNRMLEECTRKI